MCLLTRVREKSSARSVLNFAKTSGYAQTHIWRKVSKEVEAFSKTSFCHRAAPNSLTAAAESLATNQCRLASVYLRSLSRSTTIADRKFRFHFSPSFLPPSIVTDSATPHRLTRTGFRHFERKRERQRERERHLRISFLLLLLFLFLLYLS